jgi:hypothetical protein
VSVGVDVLETVVLETVAVTAFEATTEPAPLTARTSKRCEPLPTAVDAQKPDVSPKGGSTSVRTTLPSTRKRTDPGSSAMPSLLASYTAFQSTTPDRVAPADIDWRTVGATPLPVVFATVAVTLFVATTAPLASTARTSKLWEPLATLFESQKPAVSPNGGSTSARTNVPSTRNRTDPGSSSAPSPFAS